MKKRNFPRALGGTVIEDDDYAIHPTHMIVRGVKDGKRYQALMNLDRLDEVFSRLRKHGKGE